MSASHYEECFHDTMHIWEIGDDDDLRVRMAALTSIHHELFSLDIFFY